jgi:hypothetical protein
VIESEDLDKYVRHEGGDRERADESPSLVQRINRGQALRVVPEAGEMVYAQRHFYKRGIDFDAVRDGRPGRNPLEQVTGSPWLAAVTSEKGRGVEAPLDCVNQHRSRTLAEAVQHADIL